MILRQRLENLPVGRKLLLALLVLLAAVLLVSNLTFISAAYWISRQSVAPQAMHTLGELFATEELSARALSSPEAAGKLLKRLDGYAPLRAAMIYDRDGNSLAQLQQGDRLRLPEQLSDVEHWRASEIRANLLVRLPQADGSAGHLLMVASSELPGAFYTGTLTASLAILRRQPAALGAGRPADPSTHHPPDSRARSIVTPGHPRGGLFPARQARQPGRDRPVGRCLQHHAVAHGGPRAAAQARP